MGILEFLKRLIGYFKYKIMLIININKKVFFSVLFPSDVLSYFLYSLSLPSLEACYNRDLSLTFG